MQEIINIQLRVLTTIDWKAHGSSGFRLVLMLRLSAIAIVDLHNLLLIMRIQRLEHTVTGQVPASLMEAVTIMR
jgi:hypothetical protein